ncbi:MAG: NADH-quinone oxidoreductase subunit M [Gemmatimonadetes bacterium]|nr:NADH-quinone oxidoreductase subunit M [Gemmatimonadota bacterium]
MHALLLNLVLWLPLAGAAALALLPRLSDDAVRRFSTALLAVQCVSAFLLYRAFDPAAPGGQFATVVPWIADWGVTYHVALDGTNLLLVTLTAFLGPLVVLGAWTAIASQVRLFHALLLVLQCTMVGALVAQDLFLFYLFWEAMLIPMFLMIGIWGGARRRYATVKFVLYTAFGSILMLGAVLVLVLARAEGAGGTLSFAFADLLAAPAPAALQPWLFAAFALAFAIKVPMVPLHTWLPDAHVEAPTPGSVILAGVLLKMGTYGFMKLGFPLFPDAVRAHTPLFMTLAVVSIVWGACLALVQGDIKKIIAYSSISHLGYVMLGLLSNDLAGVQGAVVQMASHGLVAAGLFLLVGMVYERGHTRELAAYGGLARQAPAYALAFLLFTLASVGLPGTSGFTGEFLVLLGAFTGAWPRHVAGDSFPLVLAIAAASGVVLGALYMLRFALTFLFGPVKAPHDTPITDLTLRERGVLGVLFAAVLWMGLFPAGALRKTEGAARAFQERIAGAPAHAAAVTRSRGHVDAR